MNAQEIKAALHRRHPASPNGRDNWPGPWTCIEEWANIDLFALAAWSSAKNSRVPNGRIAYEIKVSRSDLKRELMKPHKRQAAKRVSHELYLAMPFGMLKPEEKMWVEPPGFDQVDPFQPVRCYGLLGSHCVAGFIQLGTVDRRTARERRDGLWGRRRRPQTHAEWQRMTDYARAYRAPCPVCDGTGVIAPCAAERAGAPKLWVPADFGIIEIHEDGRAAVFRKAPIRREPHAWSDQQIADLVRWTSYRPDPRHWKPRM